MATQINLPRDAEGREIPLNTSVLYDENGKKLHITSFTYKCDIFGLWSKWKVFSHDIKCDDGMLPADSLYLTPPDSWNKLLDDMERAIHTPDPGTYDSLMCGYFDSINTDCDECERKHRICRETCNDAAWLDITARIHKLMVGEGK